MTFREGTHKLNADAGWIRINTFKEGLLSRMGHDLTLEVAGFEITCTISSGGSDGGDVEVVLPKDTFTVVEPGDLSPKDRAEIQKNIRKHLPGDPSFSGSFRLSPEGGRIHGSVKIGAGRGVATSGSIKLVDQRVQAEIELSHAFLGLKPFRAPLGVIRLQDRLVLSFSLDLSSLIDASDA